MKLILAKDYLDMSKKAAGILMAQVITKPNSVLGLATGTTPIGTYNFLAKWNQEGIVDFSLVKTVNLDEYCGLSGEHPQSYRYFMNKNLFGKINIPIQNTYLPNGKAEDCFLECEAYDKTIQNLGGIDLQLLGIGHNGHIGFNEPDKVFYKKTHRVELTESTIQANSRMFDNKEEVPTYAITMGIQTIMSAKRILLISSGKDKARILKEALEGPVDPQIPASVLQLHPDVTVIADEECMGQSCT
jgi:glucosamine-6-phosphate deaminase